MVKGKVSVRTARIMSYRECDNTDYLGFHPPIYVDNEIIIYEQMIIYIDGIKIAETITEVTPGVHSVKIKCIRVASTYTAGGKTHKLIETRTLGLIRNNVEWGCW